MKRNFSSKKGIYVFFYIFLKSDKNYKKYIINQPYFIEIVKKLTMIRFDYKKNEFDWQNFDILIFNCNL